MVHGSESRVIAAITLLLQTDRGKSFKTVSSRSCPVSRNWAFQGSTERKRNTWNQLESNRA